MNLLLFVVTIIISFAVVRVGAIAFELTGLKWSLAKFQALSCFTGTGFTTKEAELIVSNTQRRRIASILMVFGNAGLVTLVATFANSIRPNLLITKFSIPFLPVFIPSFLLPWINLFIMAIVIYYTYRFFLHSRYTRKFTDILRRHIIKNEIIKKVSFEELLVSTGGYGISSIDVCEKSPIINKTIAQTELKNKDINLLAIERDNTILPNPKADMPILRGDRLICFGKLDTIKKEICSIS